MVLVLEIVEYFLILVFVKPKSNMDRHQYYIFQINFVHSRKVLSVLWYILQMGVDNVTNKSYHFQISLQHQANLNT